MEKTAIRVLLVEDNTLDVRVIKDLLSENRDDVFQVETADTLKSARERLAKAAFDAVIADLDLPDSKGLKTLQKIVSLAPDIPIIVCSAAGKESAALSCLKAGAQDYLTKGDITGPALARSLLFAVERKRLDASREKAGRKKDREKQTGQESERDAAELRNTDQALLKAAEEWRATFDSITDLISIQDIDWKIVRVNRAFADFYKMSPKELIGRHCYEVVHGMSEAPPYCPHRKVFETKKGVETEIFESGHGRHIQLVDSPIKDKKSNVVGTVHVMKDITERKQAEEALRESEAFTKAVLDNLPIGVAVNAVDPLVTFSYMNENFAKFYRTTKNKLTDPDSFWCAVYADPKLRELIKKRVLDGCASGDPERMYWTDVPITRKGQETTYISARNIPIPDKALMVSTVWDVTERVQAEEALRQSEERYRELVEDIDDIVYVAQGNGKLIYLNKAFERLSGHTREEMLQKSYLDILTPESRKAILGLFKAQKEGRDIGVFEMSFLDKDRSEKTIEVREKRVMQGGRVVEVHGLGRDVTERKQAVENIEEINRLLFERTIELGQSEEKFRSLFQTSRDFLFVADIDGVIIDANSAALEFVGYSHNEIPGVPAHNFFAQPEEGKRIIKKILENGQMINREAKLKNKNGEIVDALLTVVLRKNREGKPIGLFGSAKDITEKRKLELQLVQTEKLSTVGTMISGVAHELNNPLTSIIGNAQLLARRDVSDDIKNKLNVILRESKRSAKIVAGLLAFAREHKPERSMVDVNDIVAESLKLREYDLKVSDLDVRASLSDDLPETSADPYQLQQVFINLINNARDALANKSGGALIIRTYRRDDDIVIEFEDNGPGIAEELIKKIFDPFFTTKEVGKGTGLGLSMAYGIIREHGGTISAQSEPGKGAKFIVTIPIREGTEPIEETVKARVRPSPSARTVLVVEDEQSLRELLVDVLTEDGFSVDAASAGDKAIKLLETGKYDAVISDIKMPGIGGKELYLYVEKHHPEIAEKIIFITGDILSSDTRSFLQITNNRFIEKPFEVESLVAMLNEVLST